MKKLILYLRASTFFKNMFVVMSGTAVAQVIGFLLTPVVSRLFNADDFGLFGAFNSLVAIVVAGVTFQYSQALMLPKNDEDAMNVFAVSGLSVLFVSVISLLAVALFPDTFVSLMKASSSSWLVWLLPLAIFSGGVLQTFQAWCVRRKAFKRTSASQVIRSIFVNISQIIAGFFHAGGGGLVGSTVTANGVASVSLAPQLFKQDAHLFKYISWKRMRHQALEYRDFPLYSTPQNVMNALSLSLPVLLLTHFYGIGIAGSYAFGVRLLMVPMNFVLTALRQVLFQKGSETYNRGISLMPLFLKTTGGLLAIGLLPTLIMFIWSPQIFTFVFGDDWHVAGQYARWLILWIGTVFMNVPSILFAKILRMQRQMMFYDVFLLIARTSAFVLGGLYLKAIWTISIFSAVSAISNVFLISWIGVTLYRKEKICSNELL